MNNSGLLYQATKKILPKFRRSKKTALFGAENGNNFCGDAKATFIYMHEHKKENGFKHVYFVTRNEELFKLLKKEGYEVLKAGSYASLKAHLRAKYIFSDGHFGDVESELSNGAVRIVFSPKALKQNDGYLIAPYSDKNKNFLVKKYSLEKKQISAVYSKRLAYLKNEVDLFFTHEERTLINDINEIKSAGKKLIGYFPAPHPDTDYISQCARTAFYLASESEKNNAVLITKQYLKAAGDKYNAACSNIINLPPLSDTANFLSRIDVMITDYAFNQKDFLIFDKPVLYLPIKEDIVNEEYNFAKADPANTFSDVHALCERIAEICANPFVYELSNIDKNK